MEDHNKGDKLADKSKILYEKDSPHESHHCKVSASESVGPLCDILCLVDEITLCVWRIDYWSQRRKLCRC
jgi:hypothetical protein